MRVPWLYAGLTARAMALKELRARSPLVPDDAGLRRSSEEAGVCHTHV
jgi:hypothetical protein